jgi:hypothetical protein
MFVRSSVKRSVLAISAALAMSTVALSAALAPAYAATTPVHVVANA